MQANNEIVKDPAHRDKTMIIIGAGIAGSTMAISLKQHGYHVVVYEKDNDPTLNNQTRGKSINLAASKRSLKSFKKGGIQVPEMVPMHSRLFHQLSGDTEQRYDQFGHYLLSISRSELNSSLCQQAKDLGVQYYFNHELRTINFEEQSVVVRDRDGLTKNHPYDALFGADGSNSTVASLLDKHHKNNVEPVKRSEWVYQEYEIDSHHSEFALANSENFHIWAEEKKEQFLIALPNADHTLTVTLFCRRKQTEKNSLAYIKDREDLEGINNLFRAMAGSTPLDLFNIEKNFLANRVSSIYSRDSRFWHENTEKPKVLLIGDAAHAFPPFLGLGFNAAVEDVSIFMALLDEKKDISSCIPLFAQKRKIDTDALRDASIANAETLSSSPDVDQKLKYFLSQYLEKSYKGLFIESHTMYSFTHMPESEARYRQLYQENIIKQLLDTEGLRDAFIHADLAKVADPITTLLAQQDSPLAELLLKNISTLLEEYRQSHQHWHEENDSKILPSPFYKKNKCGFFGKLERQEDLTIEKLMDKAL